MTSSLVRVSAMAPLGLSLVLASTLSMAAGAQSAQPAHVIQPPQPVITLDAPTGSELQTHTFDSKGNRLPEAPANFRRLGEARVGEVADLHTLNLRFADTVKLTGIKSTKDFRVEPGGSCEPGNTYQKGTTCTVLVRFTPQGAGNRLGHLTISTGNSPGPMAFGLGGYGYSPIVSFVPALITTVPGTYPANSGLLSGAKNLTVDGGDTLWVSDTGNNLVRNYDSSATFRTLASGYSAPWGIAVDTFGEAYFSRPAANAMHEIYDYGPVVQINGAGTGSCPASTPCTMSSHTVTNPSELSMDPYNHMFFVEQTSGGAFSTVQPIPANLIFLYDPFPFQTNPASAAAMDAGDNIYSLWANGGDCEIVQQSLYNAENSNVSFNKVAGGHTCGFTGDGGLAGNAEIGNSVGQISFDIAGNLYFTDTANQRLRRVEYTTGTIRTVAGDGTAGYSGDGAGSWGAELSYPTGVAVNSQGTVFVISGTGSTSGGAQVIRQIGPTGFRNFGNQAKGVASGPLQFLVSNTGNSSLVMTSAQMVGPNAADFSIDPGTTTCLLTPGSTLFSGQNCYIGVKFTPSAVGPRTATLNLLDNSVPAVNSATFIGVGTLPAPTFTITSPTNGASFTSGTAITFSVSVTSTSSPAPTGTVQFKVDGANYGGPVTVSSGAASTSVTGLTQTTHTLSATYSGDSNYAAAGPISVSITVTAVKIGSYVSLSPGVQTAMGCSPLQFRASVTSATGPVPTGVVELFDGNSKIASSSLANGSAMLQSPPLNAGSHTLTAHYAGDSLHLPAVSPGLVEVGSATSSCGPPIAGKL